MQVKDLDNRFEFYSNRNEVDARLNNIKSKLTHKEYPILFSNENQYGVIEKLYGIPNDKVIKVWMHQLGQWLDWEQTTEVDLIYDIERGLV